MTPLEALVGFVVAATLLAVTPGVDTVLVVSAAARDKVSGWRAAAGVACGCLCWGALVSAGLAALVAASPLAFLILKSAGAAYLLWLGVGYLLRDARAIADAQAPLRNQGPGFRDGLLTNLLNPKVGIFYLTFLPQFIPPATEPAAFSFLLASVHVLVSLAWFAVLISGTARLARAQGSGLRKLANRLLGIVFIGLAAKAAFARQV